MSFLKRLFGDYSSKEIKRINGIKDKVLALDTEFSALTDEQLQAKTPEFKERLNNGETLDDILPEAFAACREAAWRNIHTLKDPAYFKVWLFKILSNRCKTELMKKNKHADSLPVEEYEFLMDGEDFSFDSAELKEALQSLTPPDGQIILLSVIGGFKSEELAAIYSMPASTIRSRQKRALEKLRIILS